MTQQYNYDPTSFEAGYQNHDYSNYGGYAQEYVPSTHVILRASQYAQQHVDWNAAGQTAQHMAQDEFYQQKFGDMSQQYMQQPRQP